MKYEKEFPLFKTKVEGVDKKFNLSDVVERREYFEAKAGKEIEKLKEYLDNNGFIAYLLAKKNAGKGTYTKLMIEIFGKDRIAHISVGDVVRATHKAMQEGGKESEEIIEYLKKHYRGYISIEKALDALMGRDTSTLLPTEFTLTLVKREIEKQGKKTLFIDGFPRELDQVSYSLFFRDLVDFRSDPDVFIAIDIPESVIDERMKYRVVCPKCQAPRNLKLFTTQKVGYDKEKKEFYLMCDNKDCDNARMVSKEGDDKGIDAIRERLKKDDELISKVFSLHGIPKILLRNSVPVNKTEELLDEYEITPEYVYEYDSNADKVITTEKSWVIKDDEGEEVVSLLAPPVVVSLIKQLVKVLDL